MNKIIRPWQISSIIIIELFILWAFSWTFAFVLLLVPAITIALLCFKFHNKFIIIAKWLLISIVFLALWVKIFVIRIYKIPSSSMVPTLFNGDIILVKRIHYKEKINTVKSLYDNNYKKQFFKSRHILKTECPKRGDILVFYHPESMQILVKRCIGLPGDTIIEKESELLINDKVLSRNESSVYNYVIYTNELTFLKMTISRYLRKRLKKIDNNTITISQNNFEKQSIIKNPFVDSLVYIENANLKRNSAKLLICNSKESYHFLFENTHVGSGMDFGPIYINKIYKNDFKKNKKYLPNINTPIRKYFVMGDNRDYSDDSRYWGLVPEGLIIGKATHILFSNSSKRTGLNIFNQISN